MQQLASSTSGRCCHRTPITPPPSDDTPRDPVRDNIDFYHHNAALNLEVLLSISRLVARFLGSVTWSLADHWNPSSPSVRCGLPTIRESSGVKRGHQNYLMIRIRVALSCVWGIAMKPLIFALCSFFALGRLAAQEGTWQPSPGHTQVPIWPGAAPDPQPVAGPEVC